jgi:LuxR family maltose regulon positive regulatory protein
MSEAPSIVLKPALEQRFSEDWDRCRVFLFSAPCGAGKTVTAAGLLRNYAVCSLDVRNAAFSSEEISPHCTAVLVDDMHLLTQPARQQALSSLIGERRDLHFILLSRGTVPGWLMPFQISGMLSVIETDTLLFDRETSRKMLESRGISITPAEMSAIQQNFSGYPLAMELLCRHLAKGRAYCREIFDASKQDLFVYYDEAVLRPFSLPLQSLLLSLAPFESFHLELAKMASCDPNAGELLWQIQRDTTMLLQDGLDSYRFRPIFRQFLLWALHRKLNDAEQRSLYCRAALYFELQGQLDQALDFYSRAGEQRKISSLLIKNSEKHPGVGHYRELQDYYFALPQEEILRSPSLICGMSMLTAMCLDYETSEAWYQALENYAAGLKKTDADYQNARGKLAYLDIALPQRGCRGLVDIIRGVFRVMTEKDVSVPSFSVTSTLPSIMNGGKDFCEWSKKDDLLYATMRKPVETVLGKDGIGLADCAICESKFEKGEDISRRLLTLMARLGEIQTRGTPDIEFAVVGLLARVQISQGKTAAAEESIENLRMKYQNAGETRFLGNIDAMLCRIHLRTGDMDSVRRWLLETAPRNDVKLWAMWRYQYITRAMAQIADGEYDEPLLLLVRLIPYCEHCGRIMDEIHLRVLMALCHQRKGHSEWTAEFNRALDLCREYAFLWPIAQYGAAVLPLLRECGWKKDPDYLRNLTAAVRTQAVQYPHFLKPQNTPVEPLSATEHQVLKLLCENLTNQEICDILDIKLPTAKTHVSHILQKLGVKRRNEVRDAAEKLHLI